jgi:DNA helicase HerA-like ATPase
MAYVLCLNCGRLSVEGMFCTFCHSPLFLASPKQEFNDGIYLGEVEGEHSPFHLPINPYFGFHFAFYGVTGTGKTRAAMHLAINAENSGLCLRILDVEGEWKNIIPRLNKETVYFDSGFNLKVNPFDLNDPGLTLLILKETIFMGMESEYRELSPQMNYVLSKCVLESNSIPELIERIIFYKPRVAFKFQNLDATKTALLTRLNPLKDNPILRRIFYVEKSSIDLASIKGLNLLVDLHDLDRRVAYKREVRLIYNIITTTYLREALAKDPTDDIENMFIADESQLLVPKIVHKAIITDTWVTTDFATRLRKRGESLVIITQSPSNIEDDIRKNAQNLFVFRLQDPNDINVIAGMFGCVHADEVSYLSSLLTNLDRRKAIVKTPLAKNPFILRTPEVKLR